MFHDLPGWLPATERHTGLPPPDGGGSAAGRRLDLLLDLLKVTRPGVGPRIGGLPSEDPAPSVSDDDRFVLCRDCRNPVARQADRIEVGGARQHTFANPSGIVFTIGCFSGAGGCVAAGPSSGEFTWFAGHRWRIALCNRCAHHLGWHFSGGNGGFWGLILDHLIFP